MSALREIGRGANKVGAIAARELRAYFLSPIAYVVFVVFLLYNGIAFAIILKAWMDMPGLRGSILGAIFGETIFYWYLLTLLVSVITMRLFAEERRTGTLEQLMTVPVRDIEVVLGKYLGALGFYAALWAPTLLYIYLIRTTVDVGPVAASYLGTLLIGAVFCAVGVFTSALTRNQIIAAILSFLITGGFFFVLGIAEAVVQDPTWRGVFGYFSLWSHMADFGKGVIDSRRLVFYGSTIALLLFATVRTLQAKRGQA